MKIETLIRKAREAATFRGHEMRRFLKAGHLGSASCRFCGMGVQVNTKPQPNEIDIGGEAVALNCKQSPKPKGRLSFVELGQIMLKEAGPEACQSGYGTTDPEWVGRYALAYNDIRPDGELN